MNDDFSHPMFRELTRFGQSARVKLKDGSEDIITMQVRWSVDQKAVNTDDIVSWEIIK